MNAATLEPSGAASLATAKRKRRRVVLRWLRRIALGLVVAAAVVALGLAWAPKPVPVDVAVLTRGPMRVTLDEDGRTRVKDRYLVSAPLAGSLARIDLRPGDRVEKGTVLARILPMAPPLLDARTKAGAEARVAATSAAQRQAQSAVARARVALEHAQREADRVEKLAASGAVSTAERDRVDAERRARQEELTSLEFGVRVADHELEVAKAALRHVGAGAGAGEQLEIASPVGGRVLKVLQQSEGAVAPGAPLLELGDPSHLEVVVDVLTSDAVRVAPGARATLERWGGERPLAAHVRLVEPAAFPRVSALGVEEQRVNVVLDLDEPESARAGVGDGFRVEARIVVWEKPDVVRVPEGALMRHDGGWAVFAVRGDRVALTSAEMGRRNGREGEVLRGLEPGDRVVVHPSDRVVDGARVRAR